MKSCYIVTFELKNPGLNRNRMETAIKSSKIWARVASNSFLILSDIDAAAIRDILLKFMYQGDKIYIGRLEHNAAWYGMSEDISNWIRNNQK